MNIQEIKAKCGITGTLSLVRQFEQQTPEQVAAKEPKVAQPWVSHWDNDRRIRVVMHDTIMETLKKDPSFAGLEVKKQDVYAGTPEAYTRFVVITPANIEATF